MMELTMEKYQETTSSQRGNIGNILLIIKVLVVLSVIGLGIAYWLGTDFGQGTFLSNGPMLRKWLVELGMVGPLIVIGLMAIAIVLSPLPSAPIALAAGTAYGHTWGTLYIIIGAEIGALFAFAVARKLGYNVVRKWIGDAKRFRLLGSQNLLMGIVFASRLLPFVSFDVVSYAAGLTPIKTWRFALATLAGIAPASFLIAHFGDGMASADGNQRMVAGLALGALVLATGIIEWWAVIRKKT